MNPWGWVTIGLLIGLAYGYRAWRSASRRLAAIQEEFKTPAPGSWVAPGAGQDPAAGTLSPPCAAAPQPAPLPGLTEQDGADLARDFEDWLRSQP